MNDLTVLGYLAIAAAVGARAWYVGCTLADAIVNGVAWPLAIAFEAAIRVGGAVERMRSER